MRRFHAYPQERYQDNDYWVPVPHLVAADATDKKGNPFYQRAEADFFLAVEHGKVVGRIGAIANHAHNEAFDESTAFFGFFEAESAEVASALFKHAEAWAKERGYTHIRGPCSPSMDEGPGFQLDAYDTPNFLMMTYTHPDYPGYAESNGYSKIKDVSGWMFTFGRDFEKSRVARTSKWVRRKFGDRLTFQNFDPKKTDELIKLFALLYHVCWKDNWGYVKKSDAEYDHMAKSLKLVLDPELAFVVNIDGEPAGVCLCLPDLNQVFKKMNGKLFPFGWLQFLNKKKHITQARMIAQGTVPKWRNKGLDAVIIDEIQGRSEKRNLIQTECSWVLEDNTGMQKSMAAAGCEEYKRYRLYSKELS